MRHGRLLAACCVVVFATALEAQTTRIGVNASDTLELDGEWTLSPSLPGEQALVYRRGIYAVTVLPAGGGPAYDVFSHELEDGGIHAEPLWVDETTALMWLDGDLQLAEVSLETGEAVSLTDFDDHRVSYKRRYAPEWQPAAPTRLMDGSALVLLRHHHRSLVEAWNRFEHRLVLIDRVTGRLTEIFGPSPGRVRAAAISVDRGEIYAVMGPGSFVEDTPATIQVLSLRGDVLAEWSCAGGRRWMSRLALSPDERTLLVERAHVVQDDEGRFVSRTEEGFVLIDTATREMRDGPDFGHLAAWSPDSSTIAYRRGDAFVLRDVATGRESRLARIDTGDRGPTYYEPPVWSSDGRILGLWSGRRPSFVLLDLEERAIFFPPHIPDVPSFAPIARPFDGVRIHAR